MSDSILHRVDERDLPGDVGAGLLSNVVDHGIAAPTGFRKCEGGNGDEIFFSRVGPCQSEDPMRGIEWIGYHRAKNRTTFSARLAKVREFAEQRVQQGKMREESPGFFISDCVEDAIWMMCQLFRGESLCHATDHAEADSVCQSPNTITA